VQGRPDDGTTFLSSGVMRFDPPAGMFGAEADRLEHEIAIDGLFAPTAVYEGTLLSSGFPGLTAPAVAIEVYRGDTGLDSGRPQNLFSLDPSLIANGRLVRQARVNLVPGQSTTLPGGEKVTFQSVQQFVNLQFSHNPAQGWVLVCALTMMAGLLVSLLVKRRRIWARVSPAGLQTVVELGGLARSDTAGWGDEFDRLRDRLITASSSPLETSNAD
jgi:cytochrome c biogenesis protein